MTTTTILPMLKPRKSRWWLYEGIDQGAHFLAAFAVVWLARFLGADIPPAAGMLLGFALGAVREITEGGNIFSDGSFTDVSFWALGGFAGGL